MLGLSPFWATVVKVELTDIVFAIDSILVAVAMSSKLWVILTGGILGIVMMRLVIGQLLAHRASAIRRSWTARSSSSRGSGIKLVVEYLHAERLHRLRDPAVVVARADRRDLRRRAAVCAARRSGRRSDRAEQRASELLNDQQTRNARSRLATRLEHRRVHAARRCSSAAARVSVWWLSRYAIAVHRLTRGVGDTVFLAS